MSLIELPHSGFSRFYDLQNLVLLFVKNLKFSSVIYFPELKVDPNLENHLGLVQVICISNI